MYVWKAYFLTVLLGFLGEGKSEIVGQGNSSVKMRPHFLSSGNSHAKIVL